jgi:hypothetical protein
MDLVVYSQYYRTRTADRQLEIDECLRRNLNHPGISRMVLFCESDAPPVPEGTVPVEVVRSDERITYAEWFRWVKRQRSGIGLLLNADIYLDEGLEHLAATFDSPESFLALTRYNPGHAGFHLNDYPHWTQDVWGVRADAELPESLLYASSFPLGFPGCDNRIAYVLWSHGYHVRNPCYHVRSVHLQASTARAYDKTSDRLYGGVSYVHPSLAPNEDAELEFTLWTRSQQRPAGLLVNQQAIEQGVHQLRHAEAEVAQRFLDQQQFTGLSWVHEAVGSAHLGGDLHPFASEDTVFLSMPALLDEGVELILNRPGRLEGLTLRLPQRATEGYQLELQANGEGEESQLVLQGEGALALKPGGERRFWQPAEKTNTPWRRLRLKISGPQPSQGWMPDEGAELVLFGESGAMAETKSVRLIGEQEQKAVTSDVTKGDTEQLEPLRNVRFASDEEIKLTNIDTDQSGADGHEGQQEGDALSSSTETNALKYAFNIYLTSEGGAYTASLDLKPETQTKVVLRINDQTGNNDARQAFDLARGAKEGKAINGGSATDASSRIEVLTNGWYRCSISCMFHEPLTCLHAPSLWFDNYAASTTTGTLYSGKAEILKGRMISPAEEVVDEGQPDLSQIPEPEPPLIPHDQPAYSWRRRRECQTELASAVELHVFGKRFRVLRNGDQLLFEDSFWPSIGVSPIKSVPCDLDDSIGLLLWGFGQATLELRPGFIADTKRFSSDVNFWQYPCRTEGDAFAVHKSLPGPQIKDGILQLYLGLPWATWIDREAWPTSTLRATSDRLQKLRLELQRLGIALKVHSVCQHIFWRDHLHMIKAAGVDCLWLSHKPIAEDACEGVELKPWHLYAVNAREPDRRTGLSIKPPRSKKYLASFIGAHMDHYITEVRPKLLKFKDLDDWLIRLNEEWHFNTLVYGQQVENNYIAETRDINSYSVDEKVISYNQVLSDSIFSLCPAGAGPNSLRLWESLTVGSIPVILSDLMVMPEFRPGWVDDQCQSWQDIAIFHAEAEIDTLENRLRSISPEEIERRSKACIKISAVISRSTCFKTLASRTIYLFKPQQIHAESSMSKEASVGKDTRLPIKLIVKKGEVQTQRVIHFDQVQFVTNIEIDETTTTDFKILVERSYRYNKFEEICEGVFPRHERVGTERRILELPNRGIWAETLRLSLQRISDERSEHSIEVTVGIVVKPDAFPNEIRNIDKRGVLKFASATNPTRLDQTFLTTNIANASVLKALQLMETEIPSDCERKRLFPDTPNQTHNLIGEEVGNGISMYVHLMNRNENVIKNLPNWLKLSFDELILLDWSTDGGMTHLPGIWDDPRVRIIRVENQSKFIRTLAQNLASRMSRNRKIFKCDSDVEFYGDFFGAHPLEPAEFWVGEWQQARNNNERHLHGEVYYWLEDFIRIGGYDERIKTYGHDDTNFTDRLVLSGLTKKVFNYDLMHHQEHDQKVRAQGSHGIHPMVATYANRLMATYSPFWTSQSDLATFKLIDVSSDQRYVRFELSHQVPEETNDRHIQEAMQIVGSWYINQQDLKTLGSDAINEIIWEKQVE